MTLIVIVGETEKAERVRKIMLGHFEFAGIKVSERIDKKCEYSIRIEKDYESVAHYEKYDDVVFIDINEEKTKEMRHQVFMKYSDDDHIMNYVVGQTIQAISAR